MKRVKRRRGYGPDRDPVSRHVGEPLLDRALRALLKPGELQLLRWRAHELHADQIARRHGLTASLVENAIAGILHRIGESPHGVALLEDLRSPGGPRFSALLWEGRSKERVVDLCARETCTKRFDQPLTGRTRKFCSNACRQAAYRARRAQQPPAQGAHSPQPANTPQGFRPRQTTPEFPAPRRASGAFLQYMESVLDRIGQPPVPTAGVPSPRQPGLIPPGRMGSDISSLVWIGSGKTRLPLSLVDGAHRVSSLREAFVARGGLVQTGLRQFLRQPLAPRFMLRPDVTLTSPLHTPLPLPDGRTVPYMVVSFPGTTIRYEGAWGAAPETGPARNQRNTRGSWPRRGKRPTYRGPHRRRSRG